MAKKNEDSLGAELKKLLTAKRVVIGTERTIKQARANNLARIIFTKNCPLSVRQRVQQVCDSSIICQEIEHLNNDLGTLCKKPFAISVLGIMR